MPVMCALCLQYVKSNKEADNDWFRLESNKEGTKCVCVCLSACVSVCLCVCVSVCLSVCLSALIVLWLQLKCL